MSEHLPTALQPLAAFERVRTLHEKIARCLKAIVIYSDYRDCEESASDALDAIAKKFGSIEALITGLNPETGEEIFNLAITIAKRSLFKSYNYARRLANSIDTEIDRAPDFDRPLTTMEELELREFVVHCIRKLPPFEQKLAGAIAQSPGASERDLAKDLTNQFGRHVSRHRVGKGMELIRNVFLRDPGY